MTTNTPQGPIFTGNRKPAAQSPQSPKLESLQPRACSP